MVSLHSYKLIKYNSNAKSGEVEVKEVILEREKEDEERKM